MVSRRANIPAMPIRWAMLAALALGAAACTFDTSGISLAQPDPGLDLTAARDHAVDAPAPDRAAPGKDRGGPRKDKGKPPGDRSKPPVADRSLPPDKKRPPDLQQPDRLLLPDATSCPKGLKKCGGACVNWNKDNKHCGGCNRPCAPGQHCSMGKCCKSGFVRCGSVCVNTSTSSANCGKCNNPCKAGYQCTGGFCCPKGFLRCGGKCVDPKTNPKHCGSCNFSCPSGQVCEKGACCPKGYLNCSGVCADPKWDPNHCAKCGAKCPANHNCIKAKCCVKGETNCGGACVNTTMHPQHCGGCNKACPNPKVCTGGVCGGGGSVAGCASGTDTQVFQGGMRGCKGKLAFNKRATLCAAGFKVCSAEQWVLLRGSKAPSHNYWTDDVLYTFGVKINGNFYCVVDHNYQSWKYCSSSVPMRVCAGQSDPLGNKCNWTWCGYYKPQPHDYFGGCSDNKTAGTLCCVK